MILSKIVKAAIPVFLLFFVTNITGQELFIFTKPASNMPAHSISASVTGKFIGNNKSGNSAQRYTPEVMIGISKKIMVHVFSSFSNMYSSGLKYESISIYGKYRFLSNDDIHTHFRMAFFAEASHSNNPFQFDEIDTRGDKSGIELGIVATQLWNKFALSTTISNQQVLGDARISKVLYIPPRSFQSFNYTLSAGYLLFPREYTNYKQLNVNLYAELLGQQAYEHGKGYIDLAPAIQFIFNSNTKLNIGYRFQLNGNMERMTDRSWLIGIERTFLNAFTSKNK